MLTEFSRALGQHGLILRGGFHPREEEGVLRGVATVLLVGNAGGAMWEAFAPHVDGARNPLDRWTKRVVDPIAERSARVRSIPSGRWLPFQRWAIRAETLYASPLGILIHPEYGLWHAWRAALLFEERVELPAAIACAEPLRKLRRETVPFGLPG